MAMVRIFYHLLDELVCKGLKKVHQKKTPHVRQLQSM